MNKCFELEERVETGEYTHRGYWRELENARAFAAKKGFVPFIREYDPPDPIACEDDQPT